MSTSSESTLTAIQQKPFIDSELYRCHQCKYFTKSSDSLKNHLSRHNRLEEFDCGQSTVEAFNCEACAYATNLHVCWKEHQETHRNEAKSNFKVNTYVCQKCSFQTFSALIWWRHREECSVIDLKSNLPQLNCDQCNYKTPKKHSLQNHTINEHLPEKRNYFYTCDRCQYASYNVNCLKRHIDVTHKLEEYKKWFKCAQCHYKSKYDFDLKRHLWKNHKKKKFICGKCDYKTNSAGCWNRHNSRRHVPEGSSEWFGCDQCDFKSSLSGRVNNHKRSVHKFVQWYRCDQCEFETKNCRVLEKHKSKEHCESVSLFCGRCRFKAKSIRGLRRHITFKHVPKWFECAQREFTTKVCSISKQQFNKNCELPRLPCASNLNCVKQKTLNDLQRCQKCKYFTKSGYWMRSHLMRHNSNKLEVFNCGQSTVETFSCEACDYATHLQICFIEHQQSHRTETKNKKVQLNTYVCHECSFQTFSSLIWLKYQNSGFPHLNCTLCSYKTCKKHSLKNHILNEHLPKRPRPGDYFYKCDKCQFGSFSICNVETHIRVTHRPEEFKKWFKCAQCGFKTKHSCLLTTHVWKHQRERRVFKCEHCKFKTKWREYLGKHFRLKHSLMLLGVNSRKMENGVCVINAN